MKSILIFTFSDRKDSPFLPLWISYYSKIKNSKLVILHRSSKPNIPNEYLNLIELIDVNYFFGVRDISYIPPNKLFMDYQTIFLESYDVVVYSDIDEFIVHNNLNEVLQSDFNQCLVTMGVEIVDYISNDEPFIFTKNINEQRKYMVRSSWYDKPLIVNQTTIWSDGKHNYNKYNNYVDGLFLIHLGKVCLTLTKKLLNESKTMYPNHRFIDDIEDYHIKHFNNPNHNEQPMVKITEEIEKLLDKIL
jgi:hypothetical protein